MGSYLGKRKIRVDLSSIFRKYDNKRTVYPDSDGYAVFYVQRKQSE